MEVITVLTKDRDYDLLVHRGKPECGDLTLAVKRKARVGHGEPCVVIAFSSVVHPGLPPVPVQAVTTLRNLEAAVAALRAAIS